jgi:hypothetical protein
VNAERFTNKNIGRLTLKIFLARMLCVYFVNGKRMPEPKKSVSIEKLRDLGSMLLALGALATETQKSLEKAGVSEFELSGWPTLARGMQFVVDQLGKVTGTAAVAPFDPKKLLMPSQEYYPTRKPTKPSKAVQAAMKQVAEAKKPYKKPPKDTPEP